MARKRVVIRLHQRQYKVKGEINGRSVTFIVDTGASSVSICDETAKLLGIEFDTVEPLPGRTAGGLTDTYEVNFDKVSVGSGENKIERRNVRGHVLPAMDRDVILLGMSFLGDNIDFTQDDDTLVLYDDQDEMFSKEIKFEKQKYSFSNSIKSRMEIQSQIQQIGNLSFPDNPHSIWHIESIERPNSDVFLVVTTPVPHVGYPKIRFHLDAFNIERVVRADSWEHNGWSILFT
tara:strand:- start:303 stop:1001 length:699 start_codon:yes stop_codon:yes gene_type:complete